MIKVNNLSFKYGTKSILNKVNFSIEKGELVSIIGHNGSGKTTFLKLILGILKPEEGIILINGRSINKISGIERKKLISYINQGSINTGLPISVLEVLKIGCLYDKNYDDEIINDSLNKFGIRELKDKLYMNLSGGQKQKVNLARCFIQNSEIILLDEPDSFLDQKSQVDLMESIKQLNKTRNKTILIISHNFKIVEKYSDKIYVLENEKVKLYEENNMVFQEKIYTEN